MVVDDSMTEEVVDFEFPDDGEISVEDAEQIWDEELILDEDFLETIEVTGDEDILETIEVAACEPNCLNKECGDDGCKGSCGACNTPPNNYCQSVYILVEYESSGSCNQQNKCFYPSNEKLCQHGCFKNQCCLPSCAGKDCGDDGCGGSCGSCYTGLSCISGKCLVDVTSKIPDTGQEQCSDNEKFISCQNPLGDFFGQDANYTTNPMNFTDNKNGTITDNVTGLIWMKCPAGISDDKCETGQATPMNLTKAILYCDELVLAGYSDWRLPKVVELQQIVNYGVFSPAIDSVFFPKTVVAIPKSLYWAIGLFNNTYTLCVDFMDGGVHSEDQSSNRYVRCVRKQPPEQEFKYNGDGTVSDLSTGLMWLSKPVEGLFNWQKALKYCENFSFAGYTDWRLPDIKESATLLSIGNDYIYISGLLLWSSTSDSEQPANAFYWSNSGLTPSGKSNINRVICVR